jgi:hypothetical protein
VTFSAWLAQQIERDDPTGDLARDADHDPRWPVAGSLTDYEDYLDGTAAHVSLGPAWDEYQRDKASRRDG